MIKQFFFIIILTISILSQAYGGIVTGKVTNMDGEELSYASIYVKNSTYGVSSNLKGFYSLELKEGNYTIVYSYIGYDQKEIEVHLTADEKVNIDIVLTLDNNLLGTIEIVSNTVDKAKSIMKNARSRRSYYLNNLKSYQCNTYIKTSLEKENKNRFDSLKTVVKAGSFEEHLKKDKMNLIESVSEYYFEKPNRKKEIIIAQHDYSEIKPPSTGSVTIEGEYGDQDIGAHTYINSNPYILYENILSGDYNFYKNNLPLKKITEKPILSPIATTSAISYKYDYEGGFREHGQLVHRIKVTPRFKRDALFEGTIFIQDSTWALLSVDLSVNKSVLTYCKEFRVIQNYSIMANDVVLPTRRTLNYTIKDSGNYILGNTRINFHDYKVNIDFPKRTFTNEIIQYKTDAFDKKTTYWDNIRPITLETKELTFVHTSDSLRLYYDSDIYKTERDSIYNNLNIWSFLFTGIGYRNSFSGNSYFITPLIGQVMPLGIGGYRHRLSGHYRKKFENGKILKLMPSVDYGFNNKDLKGSFGVAYTFLPLKFARTSIHIGDTYEMINNYESFESLFSRNNYVNQKSIQIAQRLEVVNGLYGELTFLYADQNPIIDLELSEWSKKIFGDLNKPKDFKRYTKSELKLELLYRIKQKYFIRRNQKIILETKYPKLSLVYRKGIKGLFGSEVDYDYLELGVKANSKIGRWGSSRWEALAGRFLNKRNLRLLEYKYFRGSDAGFFSDPMRSFQLLGPTFATPNAFARAAYIHHFNGTILNKVPIINRLKLTLAAGLGGLLIEDDNYRHAEAFVGIERIVRIKKELFRFGIYGVTADDNFSKPKLTYKIGVSIYNSFIGEWSY